tara:strand:+ start:40 stop:1275 length:1236 start_codon:yes stop_codon:yes gene_type:complete
VGLPVAVAFGRKTCVKAFDINRERISELLDGKDSNKEVDFHELKKTSIEYTSKIEDLKNVNFFIIAVPTPVNESKTPDLSYVISASEILGKILKDGDIVVYESTVYPGATEDDCVPVLEKSSGLVCGEHFTVGYSPERINPGDKINCFNTIKKVVAGQNKATLDVIANTYAAVIDAGIFRAPSIKVAEAAKVVENSQRDLNIAFMNELAYIFDKLGIDTNDVIDAASTKWNFLDFRPGIVGGHCIGVDPYYLSHKAERVGYYPQVILSGRRVNNDMGSFIAQSSVKRLISLEKNVKDVNTIIFGATFKENCNDVRNSKVVDIFQELKSYGMQVQVCDPMVEIESLVGIYGENAKSWGDLAPASLLILAVPHEVFKELDVLSFAQDCSVIVDIKSFFDREYIADLGHSLWRL